MWLQLNLMDLMPVKREGTKRGLELSEIWVSTQEFRHHSKSCCTSKNWNQKYNVKWLGTVFIELSIAAQIWGD